MSYRCNFDTLAEVWSTDGWIFPPCPKFEINHLFLKKNGFFLILLQWTHQMQFRQSCQEIFAEKSKTFSSLSENDQENVHFSLNLFFLKMFLWARRMQFWQPCRNIFCQEAWNFSLFDWKFLKKSFSSKKKHQFPLKFHVECKFDNSDRKKNDLTPIVGKKSKTSIFLKQKNFLRMFLWTLKMQCRQPAEKLLQKAKTFGSLKIRNWRIKKFAWKNFFCLRMFLWTRRLQFWQPCRQRIRKKPKLFYLKVPKSTEEKHVWKNTILKVSLQLVPLNT